MPRVQKVGPCDLALAASTSGTFLESQGPGVAEAVAIAQTDVADLPADLAATVKLTGDQTVAGEKTYTDTVDLRIPAGGYAQRVWADNTTFPYSLAATTGAVGNESTGAWVTISQCRNDIGDHIGITEANYFNVANVEPSMLNVWPDVNGPGVKIQGASGNPIAGNENATCLAFYNADAGDPNFHASAYAAQSGKKQLAIWGDGRLDWGLSLGKLPATNRQASLYRSLLTGNMTWAGDPASSLHSIDLVTPGSAGVGASQIALGRNASGTADLAIHALSSASSATTATFEILTPGGAAAGLTLASRDFGGTDKAVAKVPLLFANTTDTARHIILGVIPGSEALPGIWLGVDPTAQSLTNYLLIQSGANVLFNARTGGNFQFKVANGNAATLGPTGQFDCLGGITAGSTIVANTLGGLTPVRVGWTGTPGEEPYSGIWFTATPTLANFAFLANGATNIVNAPSGGTLQIRIANGGGANFSATSTDLDRAGVGITVAGHKIQHAAAAPVAGTYAVGDLVYNTVPTAGGFVGWVCITAGSPGDWKTFGAISS